MKRFSKISIDDIKTIQVDSGVLLKEFDVENPIFLPENVICATSGGINPVCAPEYYDFSEDVDNAKQSKETKRIRGWNVSISFTTFTTSLDLIRLALGAADISGKVLSIRQKLQYAKDFKDIWWVGERADGIIVAIKLIRSLSDSGFSLQTTKKGKGQISVTLKGHSSFAEKDKIPMEIYVFAESDIPVTPDEPVTSEMYLYGTPSETGNIGLRVGESVTYYKGAVLPNIDTVYTDELKETHPYAGIFAAFTDWHMLRLLPKDAYYTTFTDGSYSLYGKPSEGWRSIKGDYWEEDGSSVEGAGGYISAREATLWVNFDLMNEDGSVYLAKSDPIPVSGIVDYVGDIPIYEVKI